MIPTPIYPTSTSGHQTDMTFRATKRSGVRFLGLWAVLLTLALVAVACGGQSDRAFRIGVMESLTGPGETYGTVANQSKQMAADEINAAGGINGRRFGTHRRGLPVQRPGRRRRLYQAHRRGRREDHPRHVVQQRHAGSRPVGRGGRDYPVLRPGQQPRYRQRRRLHLSLPRSATSRSASTPATSFGPTASGHSPPSPSPPTTPRVCDAPRWPSSKSAAGRWWIQPHPPEQPRPLQLQLARLPRGRGHACGLLGQGVRGTGLLLLPQAQ